MKDNAFYITTTLPYVNAPLHTGHALELVRADTIARYKKLVGYDVYFNTGTDEHGIKVYEKAKEKNLEVQEFVDKGFETFKNQLKMFRITEEAHFIRTTDKHHIESAQYFCKYSAFRDKLLDFYEKNPNFIVPDFRFNEIKTFVKNGLQDFSISRLKSKMPWGIPVPDDNEHVMYVWFDALVNYISTLGWPENEEQFKKYWINGNPTQYCGKDNTRFQGAMWQAMLMAAGLPNSRQIVVNGFITGDGGVKMSKTLGNVVDPRDIVNEYGVDALRYFLLREVSSFEDSPFTIERFKDAYNSGLANGLGNLVSRILTMVENYAIRSVAVGSFSIDKDLDIFDIKNYMDKIWVKIQELDKIIQEKEPYKLYKTNPEEAKIIVADLFMKLASIGYSLKSIMPETSQHILSCLSGHKKPETPLFPRKD